MGLSPKLTKFWEYLYTVTERLNDVLYRIRRDETRKRRGRSRNDTVVHCNKLRKMERRPESGMSEYMYKNDKIPEPTAVTPSLEPATCPTTRRGRKVKRPQWYGIPSRFLTNVFFIFQSMEIVHKEF